MKAPNKLTEFLTALRILDQDGTVSLGNVFLMVMIARLAVFPADPYSLGLITLALAERSAKRFSHHQRQKAAGLFEQANRQASSEVEQAMSNLANEVLAVKSQVQQLSNQSGVQALLGQFGNR